MLDTWFKGLKLVSSKSAQRELLDLGLNLWEIPEIFEKGFDCSRSKRNRDKIERCLRKGDKILRAVAAYSYDRLWNEEVMVLIHVSIEGLKWSKLQK